MADGELRPLAEIEAEAQRCRRILDEKPSNDESDMLYVAYTALLFVLGYHVYPPSEQFDGASSEEKLKRRRAEISALGHQQFPCGAPQQEKP